MPEPLRLISLNCEGDKHWPKILPMVKDFQPDVLCFQEVFEQDMEMLKKEFDMDGIFAPLANVTATNKYGISPHGRWGVAILTTLPFEDANYVYYKGSGDHIPGFSNDNPNAINRALVTLHGEKDGVSYIVATTHFTWSPDGGTIPEQERDFQKLLKALEKAPEVILCGDFNAPRGKEIFTELSKLYTDNIPAEVTSTLDPNLHKVGEKQLMIDGLFTTAAYQTESVKVVCGVSDHCGIQAVISKLE